MRTLLRLVTFWFSYKMRENQHIRAAFFQTFCLRISYERRKKKNYKIKTRHRLHSRITGVYEKWQLQSDAQVYQGTEKSEHFCLDPSEIPTATDRSRTNDLLITISDALPLRESEHTQQGLNFLLSDYSLQCSTTEKIRAHPTGDELSVLRRIFFGDVPVKIRTLPRGSELKTLQ